STQEVAPSFSHPCQPSPLTGCRAVRYDELDLGIGPLGRAEIAVLPGRVDRAHQVHVLLRHCPRSIPQGSGVGLTPGFPHWLPVKEEERSRYQQKDGLIDRPWYGQESYCGQPPKRLRDS